MKGPNRGHVPSCGPNAKMLNIFDFVSEISPNAVIQVRGDTLSIPL